ncbi:MULTISPECIES: RnfABCDGE type electron transport complex subunit D [Pseudomonas]|jgi:electron transport complex protein RnfD|uniref:Ion-translocating oxidoreductase complex subunit D n=1 Tax=Pseudomonas canavaninivorans TaxID=2842348 RepID=A0ABX8QIU9_PSECO|nr:MULTISPECIES: RnfABCDGE type electron transport complex subunit D [Pseudomonas]MBJ2349508.1 RnfABCDGE type electron transport complex subunit D [Pseudomonas canavaninivorans]MBJ2349703.1 RnfABCDGE type electron transport complex subunit D [Pseudomonas canavaninivorans]MBJ2350107.1 RnfABCDGE type electron transport complex subunit D [Pseudomonas canavaninivorans]MBL3542568.1 RnfABCDGE type electron transport complex subunit D [Pseudomonas sp. HB05]QXI54747.1 RnfABCDGE type electron transport
MPLPEPLDERLRQAMGRVLLATLPGVLALMWVYGWGVIFNLLLSGLTALAVEALVLRLRRRPLKPALGDGSALVSATLLAVALPAYSPWWLTVTATACALLFGKHVWGGVGSNPFNPAMLGYALVLLAFPQHMSQWPTLHGIGLGDGLRHVAGIAQAPDGWAGATALDSLQINRSLTIDELFASDPAFGRWGGRGVEWVNLAFLAGGLFLLQQRVFSWHAPVGMLVSLFTVSLLCWNGSGSDSHGSPLFHLLTGATMLGAFFIVTEPVSGARTPLARLLFGAGAGLLVYLIRTWGGFPDGVAFAVLLMNLGVPALDRFVEARQRRSPT